MPGKEYRTGVKITGDSRGGVRATKEAGAALDKLTKTQKAHNTVADRGRAAIGGAARAISGFTLVAGGAVAAVGGLAKKIADKGDRLQKLSIQLGTSTEFLSGMGYAAELSGSNLESLATGFGKMQKSIADGVAGLTTAVRGFDALGLKAEELQRLAPEDQFTLIADRLGGLDDKTKRVAVAMDLFGRSGRELLPLFAQGADGIDSMRAEFERFGAVMSQDLADASAQFNDELRRLGAVGEGVRNQFAEGLLPQLTAVAQHFLEGAEASDVWSKVGETLGNTVRVLVAAFIGLKETLTLVWDVGSFVIGSLVDLIAAAVGPIVESAKTIGEAIVRAMSGDAFGAGQMVADLPKRVAESWRAASAEILKEGQELGSGLRERVGKAVEDVNDVLTRTPEIAQGAGDGLAAAGEDAEVLGKNAADAAKSLQSLLDRLDPLAAAARKYRLEQEQLNEALANADNFIDALEIEAALINLRLEYNKLIAEANGYGDAAVAAGQRATDAAERERIRRAEELEKQKADLETFETAFARGVERIDDLFADLWKGVFDGSKDLLDSITDFFKNWLAEMAHAAITRPIAVQFTNASSGLFSGGGGAGGGNWLSSIGSLFGGGGGISGLTGAAGSGAGGGTAGAAGAGSGAAGIAAVPVVGWILAGMALSASLYDKGYGVAGDGLDTTGTLATFGVLGGDSLIADKLLRSLGISDKTAGILSGSTVFSALFGHKRPKIESQGLRGEFGFGGVEGEQYANIVAKGGLFRSDKRSTELLPLDDEIQTYFDDILGSISGYAAQLANTIGLDLESALAGFSSSFDLELDEDPEVAERQIRELAESMGMDLVAAIADVFGEGVQDFVTGAADLDGQLARLAISTETLATIAGDPRLDGKSFSDFLEVAEKMQGFGEDLAVTFNRLVDSVKIASASLNYLEDFVSTDLGEAFDDFIASQNQSLQDLSTTLIDQVLELRANFTGSAEDLQRLTLAAADFTQVGLEFLALVENARGGITSSSQRFQEQLTQDIIGDEAFYDQITAQAEALALSLRELTDPNEIAATHAEILRLTQNAYSLLTPEQQASAGQGFLDFVQGVEADALEQLTEARENFLNDSEFVRGLIDEMVVAFEDPLTIVAGAHSEAAEDHMEAAQDLSDAAGDISAAGAGLGKLPGIISANLHAIGLQVEGALNANGAIAGVGPLAGVGPPGSIPGGSPAGLGPLSASGAPGVLTAGPGGTIEQLAAAVGNAVLSAGLASGQATAAAIVASDRNMKISIKGLPSSRRGLQSR